MTEKNALPSTIKSITFASENPGPRLLVLGAIHGNEGCGPTGIKRVLAEFEAGEISLIKGEVTFVPVCNPKAFEQGVRFTERNLNRYLVPHENPTTYEARLGNIICRFLERCDVLLDLHSYTAGGPPFIFVGPDHAEEYAFAASLGPDTLMTGWAKAYEKSGRNLADNLEESTGTTEYARRKGAYSVTLECGGHKKPEAIEVAYYAIHNALRHLGLVNQPLPGKNVPRLVTVQQVYYRDHEGDFIKDWKHLEAVAADEVIARYRNGEEVRAPEAGIMVMPHADTAISTEWFYLGIETPLKQADA